MLHAGNATQWHGVMPQAVLTTDAGRAPLLVLCRPLWTPPLKAKP